MLESAEKTHEKRFKLHQSAYRHPIAELLPIFGPRMSGRRENYSPHKETEDTQLKLLNSLQKELRVTTYQSENSINVKNWRKIRSSVLRMIKKRQTEPDTMKMMADAENITNLKKTPKQLQL